MTATAPARVSRARGPSIQGAVEGLDPDQGRCGGGLASCGPHLESKMITPFLTLVLAGYAAFVIVLGAVWAQSYGADLRAARARGR